MSDQPEYKFVNDLNTGVVSAQGANKYQVGGGHYQSTMQHWDYVLANQIPYLEAMIIKYLTRWRKKNGFQDLEKAKHFLKKLYETQGFSWENLAEQSIRQQEFAKATAERDVRPEDTRSQGIYGGGLSTCGAQQEAYPYKLR